MYRLVLPLCVPAVLALAQPKKQPPKAPPRVLLAAPFGAEPGKATPLTLRGLKLDTATGVKLAGQGEAKLLKKGKAAVPAMQEPARVGDTEAQVELRLPAGVAGDAVEVVVVTPAGEAAPHKVLIDRAAALAEKEPNDGFRQAQAVALGQVVEGAVSRGQDVDVYRFEAKAGDKVVAEVTAGRLGSALDSFLTLYDDAGEVVGSSDDIEGSRDSRVEAALKKAGPYYAAVTDANDQGGPAHRYRLVIRRR